jgi:hypothetical protein
MSVSSIPLLKNTIFLSIEKKRIVFFYPVSKGKYKTNFGVFGLMAGWLKCGARFFLKIAISLMLFYNRVFLGNLQEK